MRLRVSGQQTGNEYDLRSVMEGGQVDTGLPHGNLINDFVESIFSRDPSRVAVVRDVLVRAMGEQAMVDAAATIAAFNAYPRMADATGIPLENVKKEATAELREELGIETLRHNLTPKQKERKRGKSD